MAGARIIDFFTMQEIRNPDAVFGLEPISRSEATALPDDALRRLFAGESPVRVWRDLRGLTLVQLADRSGLDPDDLAGIESRRLRPSPVQLSHLALALDVAFEDLD